MRSFAPIALIFALLSSAAFAEGTTSHISRGDLLKKRQYQTNADLTFYVDPLGNDANACTGTGANACLTIQAAFNKAPKLLTYKLTFNLAAGSYAGAVLSGFTMDPGYQKTTAGILIDGVLANVTPTTGTATGTATAGSGGVAASSYGTLTDGSQTWTVNDTVLVGSFLTITGGTGVGQYRTIISNTATVLTLAGTWLTAPASGSTYVIQKPSALITSPTPAIPRAGPNSSGSVAGLASAGLQIINNNNMNGPPLGSAIYVRNIGIAAGAAGILVAASPAFVTLCTLNGGAATGLGATNYALVQADVITATTSGGGIGATSAVSSDLGVLRSLLTSSGAAGGAGTIYSNSTGTFNQSKVVASNGSHGVTVSRRSAISNTSMIMCDCGSGSSSSCVRTGLSTALTQGGANEISILGNVNTVNCTDAVTALGGDISINGILTGNALTYGARANWGGSIRFNTGSTLTAGTAELAVDDGAAVGTFASLPAAYSCLSSLATMSRVCRQ